MICDPRIFEGNRDRKAIELFEKNLQECRTLVRNITKIPVVRFWEQFVTSTIIEYPRCCFKTCDDVVSVASLVSFSHKRWPKKEISLMNPRRRTEDSLMQSARLKKWYVVLKHLPSNFGFKKLYVYKKIWQLKILHIILD